MPQVAQSNPYPDRIFSLEKGVHLPFIDLLKMQAIESS